VNKSTLKDKKNKLWRDFLSCSVPFNCCWTGWRESVSKDWILH